jgi:hypothetical protein
MNADLFSGCHPERREGPDVLCTGKKQVLRFAQNDKSLGMIVRHRDLNL